MKRRKESASNTELSTLLQGDRQSANRERKEEEVMQKSNLNDKQLEKWVQRQRQEYAAGTLSKRKIDRLERIPGWSWNPESVAPTKPIAVWGHATTGSPNEHSTNCLLNFDLDEQWVPGHFQDAVPFWFGWVIALEKMNEDQEPVDTLAYDDDDRSGASEAGKEALIERLKAAARNLGFKQFEVRNYSPLPREYEVVCEGVL